MSEKLNFGNTGSDPLGGFDAAPNPHDADLSGFDSATGSMTVPAGNYVCRIERGELNPTKAGKKAYRLRFVVVEPTAFAGFTLWRWFTLDDAAGMNRAKAALAPLGITTATHLREPYPPFGKEVYCQAVVTLRAATGQYGESNDVQRFAPCPAPASVAPAVPNPFAVPLNDTKEGGIG